MKIKHVFAQNFCKFIGSNVIDFDFYDRTEISGANEAGKTTIKRAIQYVLGIKDERGKEITGIRPHDKDGNDMNDLETTVSVTFDLDGSEKTLKKVYRQTYNKKGEVTGNTTDRYINDVFKKESEYNDYISENIASDSNFQYCLNSVAFMKRGETDRRRILADTFGTHTDQELCDLIPKFSPLKNLLEDGAVDEIKKTLTSKLYGSRGRSGTKGLMGMLNEIPARIDEQNKGRIDIDLAELELQKKAIEEKISENLQKQCDNEKLYESYKKMSDGVLELKFAMSGLQQNANLEIESKRSQLRKDLNGLDNKKKNIEYKQYLIGKDVEILVGEVERAEEERKQLAEEWKKVNSLEFDESTLVCKYCGQEYQEEKKEKIRSEFAEKKDEDLKQITDRGNSLKDKIETTKTVIAEKTAEYDALKEDIKTNEAEISRLTAEHESIPEFVDISDTKEYKKLESEIAEKEAAMEKESSAETARKSLKGEEYQLRDELYEVEKKLGMSAVNETIDKRILELEEERKRIAQQISETQGMIDLLKDFSIEKNKQLERDIEKYMEFCRVSLFRPLINGDIEECCDFSYLGEPYDRNMNHGARILAEIDICNAFQKRIGIEMPVIVEDAESVDFWRIPITDKQIIVLRRTDARELIVKEMEGN